jgi:hypothetical protein
MSNENTVGEFRDENSSMDCFDLLMTTSELFKPPAKEVVGHYQHFRPGAEMRRPRIDRILLPSKTLIDAGWKHGPIGVEGKKSNVKLGKVVAQAQDYARSSFELWPGYHVTLEWIFIWPLNEVLGDIASSMAQSRIGSVSGFNDKPGPGDYSFAFKSGGTTAIGFTARYHTQDEKPHDEYWDTNLIVNELMSGRKVGSR